MYLLTKVGLLNGDVQLLTKEGISGISLISSSDNLKSDCRLSFGVLNANVVDSALSKRVELSVVSVS